METETWYLYLIECRGGRLYTGITPDLRERFRKHLAGKGALFTRLNPPRAMIAAKAFTGRSAASRAELRMKGLSHHQKRQVAATWPQMSNLPEDNDEL
jgi:putative endonuclease